MSWFLSRDVDLETDSFKSRASTITILEKVGFPFLLILSPPSVSYPASYSQRPDHRHSSTVLPATQILVYRIPTLYNVHISGGAHQTPAQKLQCNISTTIFRLPRFDLVNLDNCLSTVSQLVVSQIIFLV